MTPGSVMLVTGATGAIGFEIAAQAASMGVIVGLHGSNQDSVDSAMGRLDARVGDARLVPLVADFRDDAAIGAHAMLVLGVFQRLCFVALPHLRVRGGTIVGFASDAGRFAAPRQAVVGAAFGGMIAFVRNLSLETARVGVRVHCISPSFVADTPVFEAHAARADAARQRAGLGLPTPTDIAPAVLFLCGAGATKITGQVISINGGMNA